jgi:hypothetical protein
MIKSGRCALLDTRMRGYDGPSWSCAVRDRERMSGRRVLPSLRGALLSAEARLRAKADATKQSTLSSRHGLLRFARNDDASLAMTNLAV